MQNESLNVLHISPREALGGSPRSAYRVHQGLKELAVTSRMLVGYKVTDEEDIAPIWKSIPWRMADRIFDKILERLSLPYLFMPSSFNLVRHRWFKDADIVQLYNIHGGYFAFPALARISKKRPVVWRLSDMWPMTGNCVYSYKCEAWEKKCGSCPILSEYPALRRDTTSFLWEMKRRVYKHSWFTLVAPSRWIANLAKQSPLLNRFPIHIIPNGLNLEIFRPIPKIAARQVLQISPESQVILFSAHGIDYPRKGGLLVKEALQRLAQEGLSDIILLIVGDGAEKWKENAMFPAKCLGLVNNDLMMATLYSAADLFVLPSLADNLPNGIIESMACGTPVVSFNVGGVPEAVEHMETGYLAAYKDANDLTKGIQMLVQDSQLRAEMSRRCRKAAEQKYSLGLQARMFLQLYEEILNK